MKWRRTILRKTGHFDRWIRIYERGKEETENLQHYYSVIASTTLGKKNANPTAFIEGRTRKNSILFICFIFICLFIFLVCSPDCWKEQAIALGCPPAKMAGMIGKKSENNFYFSSPYLLSRGRKKKTEIDSSCESIGEESWGQRPLTVFFFLFTFLFSFSLILFVCSLVSLFLSLPFHLTFISFSHSVLFL